MANVGLFKGGTPDLSFMNCEGHPVTSRPPFGGVNNPGSPPFDSHYDGAYNHVDFAAGFPFQPKIMPYQRDNITSVNPDGLAVNDILYMILVPVNHYVEAIRFDVNAPDVNLAGATVTLTEMVIEWDPTADNDRGAYVWTEGTAVQDAMTAQGKADPIDISLPFSEIYWMGKVEGGYVEFLYAPPVFTETGTGADLVRTRHQSGGIMLGIKILSLPTDTTRQIHNALNDMYLTARIKGFDSPGFL